MAIRDLLPALPEEGSALRDFLDQTVVYEKAGGVMPRGLVMFGFYGSVAIVVAGLLSLTLPDPYSIQSGGFFLVFSGQASSLDGLMSALAGPEILLGLALIGLDVYLTLVPTTETWRWAIVGQTGLGGLGGSLGVIFLVLFIFNLAIWIVVISGCIALCIGMLAALASG